MRLCPTGTTEGPETVQKLPKESMKSPLTAWDWMCYTMGGMTDAPIETVYTSPTGVCCWRASFVGQWFVPGLLAAIEAVTRRNPADRIWECCTGKRIL